ncbi:MAG: SDR family NAD(P)-dependent oxidoreductase [Bdellovibrionia bacterium]
MLAGKKIFITGASRGLGREFARRFAQDGARVAFSYSSDDARAQTALKELEVLSRSGAPAAFKISVLDESGMKGVATKLDADWGGIDILVNNAGVSEALPVALMNQDDWDRVLDTNIKGMYVTTRAFLPGLVRRKNGVILNIGSLAGVRLLAAPVHYCASKAAVKGFTESLSKEIARYKIRVNCLAPGLLEEGVARNLPEDKLDAYIAQVALKRCGTFEEISSFASFMVSDKNSYMNGATVVMDGGL